METLNDEGTGLPLPKPVDRHLLKMVPIAQKRIYRTVQNVDHPMTVVSNPLNGVIGEVILHSCHSSLSASCSSFMIHTKWDASSIPPAPPLTLVRDSQHSKA